MRDGEQLEIEREVETAVVHGYVGVTINAPNETFLEALSLSYESSIGLNLVSEYDRSSIELSKEALAEFCFSCIKEFDLIGILEKRIEGGL